MTGGGYLALPDICTVYGVSVSTARRWAREDAWRRTATRPERYHVGDAQRSYDKRQPAARIAGHLLQRYGPAA